MICAVIATYTSFESSPKVYLFIYLFYYDFFDHFSIIGDNIARNH